MITQIYEIQTPAEAEGVIDAGVDHVGSVLLEADAPVDESLRDVVRLVRNSGAISSLIPLFKQPDAVHRALDCYQPDIVHFCDLIHVGDAAMIDQCLALQAGIRDRFPHVAIMRSIPIAPTGLGNTDAVLALADSFAALSDWFLTDTILGDISAEENHQPVAGYVGITGHTCDWDIAKALVDHSPIPVVLAGGLSPENVAKGIRKVQPAGVDSCTLTNEVDVDGRPIRFKKNMARVRAFVRGARQEGLSATRDKGDAIHV